MNKRDEVEESARQRVQAHDATWALWAVLRTADEATHAMAKDLGLPYTDAIALDHVLSSPEPFGPGELARRLGMSTASATVLVDRLVASGHLARRPDANDGRRRVLHPTKRARREGTRAMAPLRQRLDAVAEGLDDETAAAVVTYLRGIADAIRDYAAAARSS